MEQSGSSEDFSPESESDGSDTLNSRIADETIEENDLEDEISLPSQTSSSSFHDDSTDEDSSEDDLQAEIFENFSQSAEESDEDSDSEEDEGSNWTEEVLVPTSTVRFNPAIRGYPKPNPQHQPGPKNIPPATSFPVDFFHLYFDIEIMQTLVRNTNAVAQKNFAPKNKVSNGSKMGRWYPTSIAELYRLLGVILHMGIKRLPTIRSYWSQDPRYSDAFVKKCFSRDRFEKLKSVLNVVNPHQYTPLQLKEFQKQDCFWRVSPLLDHLCEKYAIYYACFQDIDIDEMCIGFKGKHLARCYNPNKPEKWHFKAFCLNDSTTGYLSRFYMYQGIYINIFLMSLI
jgi:hypothetical protein